MGARAGQQDGATPLHSSDQISNPAELSWAGRAGAPEGHEWEERGILTTTMNLTEEPGVTIVSLLLRACIGLAVLSVVLPALSWAEPLMDSSSSGVGNRTDLRVTVAEETEAIAARTM